MHAVGRKQRQDRPAGLEEGAVGTAAAAESAVEEQEAVVPVREG